MKKKETGRIAWLGVSAALLLLDQITKHWAGQVLGSGDVISFLPGILGLRYAENTGAAFSAFSGANAVLSIVSAAVCVAVIVVLMRHRWESKIMQLGLSAVLAGGLGNLIDRVTRGYVIDFLEIQFMHFAIFNVADVCVTVGAGLVILAIALHGGDSNGRMDG